MLTVKNCEGGSRWSDRREWDGRGGSRALDCLSWPMSLGIKKHFLERVCFLPFFSSCATDCEVLGGRRRDESPPYGPCRMQSINLFVDLDRPLISLPLFGGVGILTTSQGSNCRMRTHESIAWHEKKVLFALDAHLYVYGWLVARMMIRLANAGWHP